MIRKFQTPAGNIITFKIYSDDSYDYTWDQGLSSCFQKGRNSSFTIHLNWMLGQGWQEVKSGFDPNDLQAQDAALFDKPCCAGGLNSALPAQYSGGKWHNIDCDTLKPPLGIQEKPTIDYRPQASKKSLCTCGSAAVGSDRHSSWCDVK